MNQLKRPYNKLSYVPFFNVSINDDFWAKRQKTNKETSMSLQFTKLEK
jgi:hypothetical protein